MSLRDVFIDELRDLYSAENQLVKSLPKMAKATSTPELKTVFVEHLEETKGQVERLKQVFQQLGTKPTGKHCKAMEGLVAEGKDAIEEEDEEGANKDVLLIGAALRIEHYEIAGYTAAIAIAKALGERDVAALLTESLNEEKNAGKNILAEAKPVLNEAASEGDDEEEDDEEEEQSEEDREEEEKSKEDEAGAEEAEDADLEEDDEEEESEEEEEEPAASAPKKTAAKSAAKTPAKTAAKAATKSAAKKASKR